MIYVTQSNWTDNPQGWQVRLHGGVLDTYESQEMADAYVKGYLERALRKLKLGESTTLQGVEVRRQAVYYDIDGRPAFSLDDAVRKLVGIGQR